MCQTEFNSEIEYKPYTKEVEGNFLPYSCRV